MQQLTKSKTQIIGSIGNRIDTNKLAHDIHVLESLGTSINGFSNYWSGSVKPIPSGMAMGIIKMPFILNIKILIVFLFFLNYPQENMLKRRTN